MKTIAMKLFGTVRLATGISRSYVSGSRPLAKAANGFADCELLLEEPHINVGAASVSASLSFPRVVEFKDATYSIDLYDGKKNVMIFDVDQYIYK